MNKRDKRNCFYIAIASAVLIAAVLAGCTASPPQTQIEPNFPSENALQEIQRVTLEESKAAFDSGEALFVDVRSSAAYAQSHIPGAVSIPLAEAETRISELNPNQWIITYCT